MPTEARSTSRRDFLRRAGAGVVATAAGAGLYAWRIEPHWVEVTEHAMPLAGLPTSWAGKRVVQISDLHCGRVVCRRYLESNLARVRAMRPDLVVVTGDWMTCFDTEQVDPTVDLIRDAELDAPIVGILGNHDHGWYSTNFAAGAALTSGLRDIGVTLLRNQSVVVDGLPIAGVDDLYSRLTNVTAATKDLRHAGDSILLCHNPDALDRKLGWESFRGWVLAGHTHGGQVRVPGYEPPVVSVLNRRYTAGRVAINDDINLYVNRALGYKKRLRLFTRPEITVFHLRSV